MKDQTVPPPGNLQIQGGTPTLSMTAHLWYTWAQAAIEREAEAWAARQEKDIGHELRASLQAVSASAISLDNLTHSIEDHVKRTQASSSPATLRAWVRAPYKEWRRWRSRRRRQPGRAGQILEALNREFQLKKLVGSGELNQRVRPLFRARTLGLHHHEEPREVVRHPSGTSTTALSVDDYSADKASDAVGTLLWVLRACTQNPRESTGTWAELVRRFLDALEEFRRQRVNLTRPDDDPEHPDRAGGGT